MSTTHPYMPERITTSMDGFEFEAVLGKMRTIADALDSCVDLIRPEAVNSELGNQDGMRMSFWRNSKGLVLKSHVCRTMTEIFITEDALPDHATTVVPQDAKAARLLLDRWLAIMSLPRTPSWGCQRYDDDIGNMVADRAGAMLATHNPMAIGQTVEMPVPSPYGETGPITVAGKPAFATKVSRMLTSRLPITSHVSIKPGSMTLRIGVPFDVPGRCMDQDPVSRLRMLAETAGMDQPLLKAGRETGR